MEFAFKSKKKVDLLLFKTYNVTITKYIGVYKMFNFTVHSHSHSSSSSSSSALLCLKQT